MKTAPNWINTSTQYIIRYAPSGTYYLRKRIAGKLVRKSLKTQTISVAKLRLPVEIARLSAQLGAVSQSGSATLLDCFAAVVNRVDTNPNLMKRSKEYRRFTLKLLQPFIQSLPATRSFTRLRCEEWFSEVKARFSPTLCNNLLGSLRLVVAEALSSGLLTSDPTIGIKRAKIVAKKLTLPSPDEFRKLVTMIFSYSRKAADLVEFLAYSGCRLSEARALKWSDISDQTNSIFVTGKGGYSRNVPMIAQLRLLLKRLGERKPNGLVLSCRNAEDEMTRACNALGITRITHHDLRHLFATACIEAGVDIPTVSRWLGHRDGGVLALRTYGHLREAHSSAAAKRVRF